MAIVAIFKARVVRGLGHKTPGGYIKTAKGWRKAPKGTTQQPNPAVKLVDPVKASATVVQPAVDHKAAKDKTPEQIQLKERQTSIHLQTGIKCMDETALAYVEGQVGKVTAAVASSKFMDSTLSKLLPKGKELVPTITHGEWLADTLVREALNSNTLATLKTDSTLSAPAKKILDTLANSSLAAMTEEDPLQHVSDKAASKDAIQVISKIRGKPGMPNSWWQYDVSEDLIDEIATEFPEFVNKAELLNAAKYAKSAHSYYKRTPAMRAVAREYADAAFRARLLRARLGSKEALGQTVTASERQQLLNVEAAANAATNALNQAYKQSARDERQAKKSTQKALYAILANDHNDEARRAFAHIIGKVRTDAVLAKLAKRLKKPVVKMPFATIATTAPVSVIDKVHELANTLYTKKTAGSANKSHGFVLKTLDAFRSADVFNKVKWSFDHGTHRFGFKINQIFEISQSAATEKFDALSKKIGNVTEAYHGTSFEAAVSITAGGFKVTKPKTGRMIGDGIYGANASSKSMQYLGGYVDRTAGTRGVLLICKNAQGKVVAIPPGMVGNRSLCNKFMKDTGADTLFASKKTTSLKNDEWVCKDAAQFLPLYWIDITLDHPHRESNVSQPPGKEIKD